MVSRRVVIGKYNDGVTYGLRVSLPGHDALTEDSNFGSFSFDSNWSDIVQTAQMGIFIGPPRHQDPFTGSIIYDGPRSIPFTDLGYVPYVEVRALVGSTIYDDYVPWLTITTGAFGVGAVATRGAIFPEISAGNRVLYLIYKIPVPSG